jgi:hypothetical protein
MLPLEYGDNSRWGAWRMHGAKSIVLVKMNGHAANLAALGKPARLC